MLPEPITASFVLEKAALSLAELRWAFDRGIIGSGMVVEAASAIVSAETDSPIALRLALLEHEDLNSVGAGLSDVAPLSTEDEEHTRRKWVWLVLSWVYERGHSRPDVFDQIESMHADVGYPEEMVPFGPYAPAYQAKGDPAEVRQLVLGEWRRHLANGQSTFGREQSRMKADR